MTNSHTSPQSILAYIEDPGAANYLIPLLPRLVDCQLLLDLVAGGTACQYLRDRQIAFTAIAAGTNAQSLLQEKAPQLLLVGTAENPDTLGLQLIASARSMGIPSVGLVDAYANADRRFRGRSTDPLAFVPDWLLVPDRATQEVYVELGYASERVIVCGHPHYDWVRQRVAELQQIGRATLRQQLLPHWPGDRPIVMFAAEISAGLDSQQYCRSADYTFVGTGRSDRRTDIAIEELLLAAAQQSPPPYLVLRLHPKNTLDEFAPYRDRFHFVSRGGVALDWVYCADLVVGMTSMLLAEAQLAGLPVLAIVPRAVEIDWLPAFNRDQIAIVRNRAEFQQQFARQLQQIGLDANITPLIAKSFSCDRQIAQLLSSLLSPRAIAQSSASKC